MMSSLDYEHYLFPIIPWSETACGIRRRIQMNSITLCRRTRVSASVQCPVSSSFVSSDAGAYERGSIFMSSYVSIYTCQQMCMVSEYMNIQLATQTFFELVTRSSEAKDYSMSPNSVGAQEASGYINRSLWYRVTQPNTKPELGTCGLC